MIAEETSRLRRLDALFAEKVLGCKVAVDPLDGESILFQIEHDLWGKIPAYTRSLDAAWEGATKIGFFSLEYFADTRKTTANVEPAHIHFRKDGEHGQSGSIDHPAEALVLACLRAVGVSEEELK